MPKNGNITTVQYDVKNLIFAEYNPRELTKDQHQDLKDSITRFGFVDPLIVNTHKERKNILVGGHQRLRIAKELGYKDVPCVEVDLTPDKEKELNVYGPPPTKELTEKLIGENDGAYWHDFVARTNHPLSLWAYQERGGKLPRRIPIVNSYNIKPGIVSSGKDWEITSARVEHVQPYLDSLAYRVNTEKGSIVFSGDTRPCQSLVDLSKGCDVLVMECIRLEKEMAGNSTELSESSALAAGQIAKEAGVKMLILTHQAHYLDTSKNEVIEEVQINYKGRIEWANETTLINY